MIVNAITAVTRHENLPALAESLSVALRNEPRVDLAWYWKIDHDASSVGGQAIKNELISHVDDGWVWVLDDDTLAHPYVFNRLADVLEFDPMVTAVVFDQLRADGRVLEASRENVRPGAVDIGQAFLWVDVIGSTMIHESYEGDGLFLESVLGGLEEGEVAYVNEQLTYHNRLRPGTS